MKKCSEHIQEIADFIDGEVDESLCLELEKHLKDCENCRIMVDTLKQTFVLCRDGKRESLPEGLRDKLNQALKKKWDEKYKKDK